MYTYDEQTIRYLELLSQKYPNIAAASTEIINLEAILNLPKGTEHVLSDLHGEADRFLHILKNGSGAIRIKIEEEFGPTLSIRDKKRLATLIYYPEQKLDLIEKEEEDIQDWYQITLYRLIRMCKRASAKYTRSKVRKALPADFAYIIEELLHEKEDFPDKEDYYNEIIMSIIRIDRAREFIIALCELIQRLVIDHLHIVGDIYDRGPKAAAIMDRLMSYHSVDIQWGNHDILWMGAASGHAACIANVVRICARYGNLDTLEEDYGINLIPLVNFAVNTYKSDPCQPFSVRQQRTEVSQTDIEIEKKMHKAIAVIEFKLEGQLILRRPEFKMEKRLLLDKINFEEGTITIDGQVYPLRDTYFPTVDPKDPYALTADEKEVVDRLVKAFVNCEKLQRHARFLFSSGSLYLCYNNNLYFHGCIPFNEDGTFRSVTFRGKSYKGRALYDYLEACARKGYYLTSDPEEKSYGQDVMWFTWSSENSPVYGKAKMATFERYFLAEKETHVEKKNPYYTFLENEDVIDRILREFGLDPKKGHIVNGHVPVKRKDGESPVKCGGKVLVIDGGFSRAYQKETGIAGYTLIYNSYGLRLVAHEPFESTEAAIAKEKDIHSETTIVSRMMDRCLVGDTDIGRELKEQVKDLERLLAAYRNGEIIEKI